MPSTSSSRHRIRMRSTDRHPGRTTTATTTAGREVTTRAPTTIQDPAAVPTTRVAATTAGREVTTRAPAMTTVAPEATTQAPTTPVPEATTRAPTTPVPVATTRGRVRAARARTI